MITLMLLSFATGICLTVLILSLTGHLYLKDRTKELSVTITYKGKEYVILPVSGHEENNKETINELVSDVFRNGYQYGIDSVAEQFKNPETDLYKTIDSMLERAKDQGMQEAIDSISGTDFDDLLKKPGDHER